MVEDLLANTGRPVHLKMLVSRLPTHARVAAANTGLPVSSVRMPQCAFRALCYLLRLVLPFDPRVAPRVRSPHVDEGEGLDADMVEQLSFTPAALPESAGQHSHTHTHTRASTCICPASALSVLGRHTGRMRSLGKLCPESLGQSQSLAPCPKPFSVSRLV